MARGQRWPKEQLDLWVEQWWRSRLTSLEFVRSLALPLSSRTLRAHGERHFGEVLRELDELRALNRPASDPTPDRVRQVAETSDTRCLVSTHEPSKPKPVRFIFDDEDDALEPARHLANDVGEASEDKTR